MCFATLEGLRLPSKTANANVDCVFVKFKILIWWSLIVTSLQNCISDRTWLLTDDSPCGYPVVFDLSEAVKTWVAHPEENLGITIEVEDIRTTSIDPSTVFKGLDCQTGKIIINLLQHAPISIEKTLKIGWLGNTEEKVFQAHTQCWRMEGEKREKRNVYSHNLSVIVEERIKFRLILVKKS